MSQKDLAGMQSAIRPCTEHDVSNIFLIINAAAIAYKGVIPADCWSEPYMPLEELEMELAAGVRFVGYTVDGTLVGVMGIQPVRNVRLIRHAYVLPEWQGHRVGFKLLEHLRSAGDNPILIGTWAAASWAIRFYERNGFSLAPQDAVAPLLKTYWNVPARQVETSVVLSSPAFSTEEALRLIADG